MKRYDIDQINYIFECNCDGDNTYVPYETAVKLAKACELYAFAFKQIRSETSMIYKKKAERLYKEAVDE